MDRSETGPGAQRAAWPTDVQPEEISQLMDGELDANRVDVTCQGLRETGCMATWVCYHVIGDVLRGSQALMPGFAARFASRLSAEPTVLVPQRRETRPLAVAWALAATVAAVGVVGWVAVTMMPAPTTVIAAAKQAASVRAADARPAVPDNEYLLVHQEYSPTTAIQGVRPYLRAVAAGEPDARR